MKQVPFSFSRHVDEGLVEYDPHIIAFAKKYAVLMDSEDFAQLLRIKFASTLTKSDVNNAYAYLKKIAYHEYVNSLRRQKLVFSLPMTSEGEIQQGYWLNGMNVSEGLGDPQIEVEQAMDFNDRLDQLARVIITLPCVQKRVAICTIRDNMDNPTLFAAALACYGVDSSLFQWPSDPTARQRLQSSYAPVRRKLAQALNVDLSEFKTRGPSKTKSCLLISSVS